MHPTAAAQDSKYPNMPVLVGEKTHRSPLSALQVSRVAQAFKGASQGQCYRGPSGVSDDGLPWVVVITTVPSRIRALRTLDRLGALVWVWNATASPQLSLSVVDGRNTRPFDRWFGHTQSAVVQHMAQLDRVLLCVAHPDGQSTGWFDLQLDVRRMRPGQGAANQLRDTIASVCAFPTPGINNTRIGMRVDPRAKLISMDGEGEIPLWAEPVSDFWSTLSFSGPWSEDLSLRDRRIAAWGAQRYRVRMQFAKLLLYIAEQTSLDGKPTHFDECGKWRGSEQSASIIEGLCNRHPALREWFCALAGPQANAQAASLLSLELLREGRALFALLDRFPWGADDVSSDLHSLMNLGIEAAFLSPEVTQEGSHRPFLKNTGNHAFELGSFALDESYPLDGAEEYWRTQSLSELIDGHLFFGPRDVPAPMRLTNERLGNVRLACTLEQAQDILMDLLNEAVQARQWSIPWGARVQVQIGPFVAMRIFEHQGEFSCQFLDEQDRYLSVCIGLAYETPQVSCRSFLRPAALHNDVLGALDVIDGIDAPDEHDEADQLQWNEDASMTLKLIAGAIVRDFLVIEERSSLFATRPMRRRVAGRQVNTIIYLPRVRYSHVLAPQIAVQAEDGSAATEPARARHAVSPHIRRAASASSAQRFLAQRYGIRLPQGFTFVRPHERGADLSAQRIAIYRSRSASRMIFEGVNIEGEATIPKWFEFEKDCARLLRSRGMDVVHQAAQRDGDGGVDLFATDSKGQTWVVQCKCYAAHRSVGPDVVRELIGAIALADAGAAAPSKGMIITTSGFTAGAVSTAMEAGFEIVDGQRFATLLGALP